MKMPGMGPRQHDIEIPSARGPLTATRQVPDDAKGLVVIVHADALPGRNGERLLRALVDAGLATLRLDLSSAPQGEPGTEEGLRFGDALLEVLDWSAGQPAMAALPLGLFGHGRGAGAVLFAAARRGGRVGALVIPAGRPDLAGEALAQVGAPTLLIVGGEDQALVDLNRNAMRQVRAECELQIVPGAGRRFEEDGAEESLVDLTRAWFERYLARALGPEPPRPREGGSA